MAAGARGLTCLLALAMVLLMVPAVTAAEAKCQTKDGLTTFQWLERTPNVTVFTSLIRQAGLIGAYNEKKNRYTIFVPLDYAFGALLPPGKGFFDILPSAEVARVLVNYHTTVPAVGPGSLEDGMNFTAGIKDPKGDFMSLFLEENPLDIAKPYVIEAEASKANLTRPANKPLNSPLGVIACNSVLYLTDAVLLPSTKLIVSEEAKVSAAAAERTALTYSPLVTPREDPAKKGKKPKKSKQSRTGK